MKALFLRHCETNYNVLGLCNSDPSVDVHLTDNGKAQARELSENLKARSIDLIFVSELPRTKETADIISVFHQAPIKVDPRINDRKTGLEGQTVSKFEASLRHDRVNAKINDGESFQEEHERVYSFLSELNRLDYDLVLVITHLEIMQIVAGYYYELGPEQVFALDIKHGQILEIDISDWRGY